MLRIVPVTLREANAFVLAHHRHHAPVVGARWSIGVSNGSELCGVAICGRPKARMLPQDTLLEINRVATNGSKNACSKLYGTCASIAKLMGFTNIETAILESENGTSLRAAGFVFRRMTEGGDWNRASRGGRRIDQPMCKKQIWGKRLVACVGRDPLCPCQDGDMCHYKGPNPWPVRSDRTESPQSDRSTPQQ